MLIDLAVVQYLLALNTIHCIPCYGQVLTLFRAEVIKIIIVYPVQDSEAKKTIPSPVACLHMAQIRDYPILVGCDVIDFLSTIQHKARISTFLQIEEHF